MTTQKSVNLPGEKVYGANALIIYGGGGHGRSLIDLVRALPDYRLAGIVDDSLPPGSEVLGAPVLGGNSVLEELAARGLHLALNAVGGIGNLTPRLEVFERLKAAGFNFPTVIHPAAVVEPSARLADGVQVFALAYVGSNARVGFGCILNTGVIISHDCVLEDVINISPGGILAGGVYVGAHTQIGMGATINLDLKIGARVRIGNGATIKAEVPDGTVVRAGGIWPR